MKKRRTVEEARKRPFLVETSRVRVLWWLVWGILGTMVPAGVLVTRADTTAMRIACLGLMVMIGILPLLVVLGSWPIGKPVIRMTESHLEVLDADYPWDEIRSAHLETPHRRTHHIRLWFVDGSIRRIEDGLYTLPLRDVYWEICKRLQDADPEIRRNDPCPCGSRRKYKKCCGRPR